MKVQITRWLSFTWPLLPSELPEVKYPKAYSLQLAAESDHHELRYVIEKSFSLDPSWNSTLHEIGALVSNAIARALPSPDTACLVLRHGPRIIGGAILTLEPDAVEQFAVGPCVLSEYRNRGFGTLLLGASLRHLCDAGFSSACAVTREGAPVARFLYPKFGGQSVPIPRSLAA